MKGWSVSRIIEITSNVLVIVAIVAAAVVYYHGHTGSAPPAAGPQKGDTLPGVRTLKLRAQRRLY